MQNVCALDSELTLKSEGKSRRTMAKRKSTKGQTRSTKHYS
jgi:hypothetical protein